MYSRIQCFWQFSILLLALTFLTGCSKDSSTQEEPDSYIIGEPSKRNYCITNYCFPNVLQVTPRASTENVVTWDLSCEGKVVDTIAAAFHEQARLRGESGKDIFLGPDYPLQITAYADIARLQVVGAPVSDRSSDLTGQFSLKLRNECLSEVSHGANSSNIEKPLNELTNDDLLWLLTSNLDSVLAEEDRENEIAILCDRTRWTALQTYATITLVATLKDGSKISAILK